MYCLLPACETFFVDIRAAGPGDAIWSFPTQLGTDALELVLDEAEPLEGEPPLAPGTRRYRGIAFALDEVALPPIPLAPTTIPPSMRKMFTPLPPPEYMAGLITRSSSSL